MSNDLLALLIALLSGSFITSIVQGIYQRKKLGADYADVIAKSATGLLKPLASRVEELQEELQVERSRVRTLARDLDDARESLERARRAVKLLTEELGAARREAADERDEIKHRRRATDYE